jgi:hypothetical protein
MPLIADSGIFQKRLGALPLATYQAGETVLAADSRTGRLLILKEGAVAILKQNIEIASATTSIRASDCASASETPHCDVPSGG